MNSLLPRSHRSVTERLADRLDDVEPALFDVLQNQAKLIADAVKTEARVTDLDRASSHHEQTVVWLLQQMPTRPDSTLWQRLRWLVTGQ